MSPSAETNGQGPKRFSKAFIGCAHRHPSPSFLPPPWELEVPRFGGTNFDVLGMYQGQGSPHSWEMDSDDLDTLG